MTDGTPFDSDVFDPGVFDAESPRILPTVTVSATVYEAIAVSATVYEPIEVS